MDMMCCISYICLTQMSLVWFKRFREGHEVLEDDPGNGCSSTAQNVEMVT